MEALGLRSVEPLEELMQGTVLARAGDGLLIAKAGGFGGADAILRLLGQARIF